MFAFIIWWGQSLFVLIEKQEQEQIKQAKFTFFFLSAFHTLKPVPEFTQMPVSQIEWE